MRREERIDHVGVGLIRAQEGDRMSFVGMSEKDICDRYTVRPLAAAIVDVLEDLVREREVRRR
jgi:hypothetical protein